MKAQIAGLHPKVSDLLGLGWGLGTGIPAKSPAEADALVFGPHFENH